MKLGLLTFHRAENFGAVLQCYALQCFLTRMGYMVEVIDYRCPSIERMYHIFNPSILWSRKNVFISFKRYFHRFLYLKERKKKKEKYCSFRNDFLRLSAPVKIYPNDDYDAYIVGSDQVWNFGLTSGPDHFYLLNIPIRKGAKRISYAASAELSVCDGIRRGHYREALQYIADFDSLSVREQELKESIETVISKEVETHIDPTFLLSKVDYERIMISPPKKGYILVYHLYETKLGSELASLIADKYCKSVVEIHAIINGRNTRRHYYDLGPLELLGYVANAETIITTSYHGLALSLIMEKDVYVINEGVNSRQRNLLDRMKLKDRFIQSISEYGYQKKIDYSYISSIIDEEKHRSRQYFHDCLPI